jgi:signal peptidase I
VQPDLPQAAVAAANPIGAPLGGPIPVPSLYVEPAEPVVPAEPSLQVVRVAPEAPRAIGTPTAREAARRRNRWVIEWLVVLGVALLLAVGVRTYVLQMFYIPSGSMLPTLQIGDRIVVDKLSYHLHAVQRGNIVVFRRPPLEDADYADLVKRVIGLPGDTISAVNGRVYIDGKPLAEPWLPTPMPMTYPSPVPYPFSLNHPYTVPAGEYYVMGDNRTDSEDSRYFGPIPANLIVGKVAFVVWPLTNGTWLLILSVVASLLVVALALAPLARRRPVHLHRISPVRGPPASDVA